MPKWISLPVLLAVIICASLARGSEGGEAILGLWLTQDKDAQFEIYRCGQEYCGRITSLEDPAYPLTAGGGLAGLPRMDRKNPDPRLRGRPLLGLTIFENFRYEEGNSWWGRVYNPDDGNTYKCKLSITKAGDRLKVRGYLGVVLFGQTQTWTRQSGSSHSDAGAPAANTPPG